VHMNNLLSSIQMPGTRPSAVRKAREIFAQLVRDEIADPVVVTAVLLPEPTSRWRSFGMSVVVLSILLLMSISIQIFFPDQLEPVRRYFSMAISHSSPEPPKLSIRRTNKSRLETPVPAPVAIEAQSPPRLYVPVVSPARPTAARRSAPPEPLAEVAVPASSQPALTTPALSIPALVKPREAVQTGLFGGSEVSVSDTNGSGYGGIVNAKFGVSNGSGNSNGGGRGRGIVEGSFSESTAAKGEPKHELPKAIPSSPVKILSKPRPEYTAEGRSRGIEGDVVLKVTFTALGKVEVLSVVHSLGFGLDESAQAAAKQIQFQPATSNGAAVDSPATVHITFQIAQ
jgi:TonB family protein